MRKIVLVIMLICCTAAMPACSIYKAATAPPPIPLEKVTVGKDRESIISILGTPKTTENSGLDRTDMHEFMAGYDGAGKVRILLYVAGDVFTLGLAELIFWPLELALLQGDKGRAVISYDKDNLAKKVYITNQDGSPWSTGSATQPDPQPESY